MRVILYGIKTCDTCRRAAKELKAAGQDVMLRDIRAEPLSAEEIARFFAAFGDSLVNRRSTTWRGLDEAARTDSPVSLLEVHPTLMKRPIVESERGLTLGWDSAARQTHQ